MPKWCQWAALFIAILIVAAVLLPPLSAMGKMLFAAHMAQHLLLITAAAPLLVLGGARLPAPPVLAWALFVGVFLFWHWPPAFRWAANHPAMQLFELVSILFAALVFWSAVFTRGSLSDGARALMATTAAVATDLPGVVMVFSPMPFAQMPHEDAGAFGLSLLADQQIAGLLMWVPANLVFFGIATFLFARWLESAHLSSMPP